MHTLSSILNWNISSLNMWKRKSNLWVRNLPRGRFQLRCWYMPLSFWASLHVNTNDMHSAPKKHYRSLLGSWQEQIVHLKWSTLPLYRTGSRSYESQEVWNLALFRSRHRCLSASPLHYHGDLWLSRLLWGSVDSLASHPVSSFFL